MQRTLREHLTYLEQRIEALHKEMLEPGKSRSAKNEISIDLGIAERSLLHFQKAFELEEKLSNSVRNFKANRES